MWPVQMMPGVFRTGEKADCRFARKSLLMDGRRSFRGADVSHTSLVRVRGGSIGGNMRIFF